MPPSVTTRSLRTDPSAGLCSDVWEDTGTTSHAQTSNTPRIGRIQTQCTRNATSRCRKLSVSLKTEGVPEFRQWLPSTASFVRGTCRAEAGCWRHPRHPSCSWSNAGGRSWKPSTLRNTASGQSRRSICRGRSGLRRGTRRGAVSATSRFIRSNRPRTARRARGGRLERTASSGWSHPPRKLDSRTAWLDTGQTSALSAGARRIWGTGAALLWGAFFVEHLAWFGIGAATPPLRVWLQHALHVAVVAGLLAAWRYERLAAPWCWSRRSCFLPPLPVRDSGHSPAQPCHRPSRSSIAACGRPRGDRVRVRTILTETFTGPASCRFLDQDAGHRRITGTEGSMREINRILCPIDMSHVATCHRPRRPSCALVRRQDCGAARLQPDGHSNGGLRGGRNGASTGADRG